MAVGLTLLSGPLQSRSAVDLTPERGTGSPTSTSAMIRCPPRRLRAEGLLLHADLSIDQSRSSGTRIDHRQRSRALGTAVAVPVHLDELSGAAAQRRPARGCDDARVWEAGATPRSARDTPRAETAPPPVLGTATCQELLQRAAAVPSRPQAQTSHSTHEPAGFGPRTRRRSKSGYCIRCSSRITFDFDRPYCFECYQVCEQFENWQYVEQCCQGCGRSERTTRAKPLCGSCFRSEAVKR